MRRMELSAKNKLDSLLFHTSICAGASQIDFDGRREIKDFLVAPSHKCSRMEISMESLVIWFTNTLGEYISREMVIFIISMIPILELRGGLLAASLLKVPILTAIPLCVIGNILPIPFILLFIKQIFKWMKKFKVFRGLIEKLENRAMNKSDSIKQYEFWGLALFVGIPLPGTGAWTGSLIAALLEIDFKKAIIAELVGIVIATIIMSIVSYGLLGVLIH